MKKTKIFIFGGLVLMFSLLVDARPVGQRLVKAIPVEKPVEIDGILREGIWQKCGYCDFTQSDPYDGETPTEKTMVWVSFDEKALYVAARLFDSEPGKVIGRLGRRDDMVDSDWFIIALDPYFDRRTGYQFAINPSGSVADMTLYNDTREDPTWDGVWDGAAKVDAKGWTVEMRIPYHQLRFKKKKEIDAWGINFTRIIKRKNEKVVFAWTPKEESGYVSRFARLIGIANIKQERNMELLPYSAGKGVFSPGEAGNSFKKGERFSFNAGLDAKIGLQSNLTLDLSFNPDFGQVEADPAVINLSASETYYEEKRPFFIEGSSIFNFGTGGTPYQSGFGWINPSFFYSRRIGHPPVGVVDTRGHVDYPDWATILAAAKLTGKVGKGWNVGFISTLTQREYAEVDLNEERSQVVVEPFTYYGVLRVQKESNKGRQGLGFIATSVLRNLRTEDLESVLPQKALCFAVDGWTFLNEKRSWVLSSWFGGTHVAGSGTAITQLQHSYLHYYQRPDATHVELRENATSLNGWGGRLYLAKLGGSFYFNASLGAISPGFDTTDMGFQFMGDIINGHVEMGYFSLKPGKIFRNWHFIGAIAHSYDFGWNKTSDVLHCHTAAKLLNYWEGSLSLLYGFERWSNILTRGGPLTLEPAYLSADLVINSDDRKSMVLFLYGGYFKKRAADKSWAVSVGLTWKPKKNVNISIEPTLSFDNTAAQWVGNFEDPLMTDTYGARYVFGSIDQKTISCSIRFNWVFTPRLSLQAYIQPFIAVGAYDEFKELARPGSFDFNVFGEGGSGIFYHNGIYTVDPDGTGAASPFSFENPDFNYKSLRGTVVLRWEYQPGSSLYAVWTQNRADFSSPGDFNFGRDFGNLLKARGDNIFMIKFTHRLKL